MASAYFFKKERETQSIFCLLCFLTLTYHPHPTLCNSLTRIQDIDSFVTF